MYIIHYALALVALSAGLVHSWDIFTTTGNRIEFYTNNAVTHKIEGVSQTYNITASVYDELNNILLFVNTQSGFDSIIGFNISTNEFHSIVTSVSIEDIAFDPVTRSVFWTESKTKTINYLPFKSGFKVEDSITNLLTTINEIPTAITVDSCRGDIYWSNSNPTKPTIEKIAIDGTGRKVLVNSDIHKIVSLTIDQQARKLIWSDSDNSRSYRVRSAYLNGTNIVNLVTGSYIEPKALAFTKDYIYIAAEKNVWFYKKQQKSVHTMFTPTKLPSGITSNYTIEEQIKGIDECGPLRSLLQQKSVNNDPSNIPEDLFCVNGTKFNGESICNCTPGFIGKRCDVSVCQNYCFQGYCNVTAEGQPNCSCSTGYSGDRCEINVCFNYCQNNGVCYLNELDKPVCECNGTYEGSRCEVAKVNNIQVTTPMPHIVEKNISLVDLGTNHKTAGRLSVFFEILNSP